MRHIQLKCAWVPGGWCSAERLDCSAYYPHFARHLLNQRHVILRGGEALARRDALFEEFSADAELFVRPAGMQKLFAGRRVSREDFASALAPARYDPATMVVIAPPKPIAREWRLVVADDEVTAASHYQAYGVIRVVPDCPTAVRVFAGGVLADVRWRPDTMFMMDVCESEGSLYVLELNSFSCSALYACDAATVVAAAARAAAREWQAARV
jgi:hypothetical protein